MCTCTKWALIHTRVTISLQTHRRIRSGFTWVRWFPKGTVRIIRVTEPKYVYHAKITTPTQQTLLSLVRTFATFFSSHGVSLLASVRLAAVPESVAHREEGTSKTRPCNFTRIRMQEWMTRMVKLLLLEMSVQKISLGLHTKTWTEKVRRKEFTGPPTTDTRFIPDATGTVSLCTYRVGKNAVRNVV